LMSMNVRDGRHAPQASSAQQALWPLPQALLLATQVGALLGGGALLQRTLPA
jgi:hypothetical protein